MSFSLGTPLTVHRLPTDKLMAAWAVYKAGLRDWRGSCAFPRLLHEVLASSLCVHQYSLIHSFASCRQQSFIPQSITEKLQDREERQHKVGAPGV